MAAVSSKRQSDACEPASKRFKSSFQDTITILVGEEETPFTVHRAIACAKSPFLAAACSDRWAEGKEGVVRLPTYDAQYFECFLHWLYFDQLEFTALGYQNNIEVPHLGLAVLWSMSNYLGCQSMGNKLVDQSRALIRKDPHVSMGPSHGWEHLPLDCGMRRLFIDHIVWVVSPMSFDQFCQSSPKDVLVAIARAFATNSSRAQFNPVEKSRCYYHDHKYGEKCQQPGN